jgi:soluble lytic murein transglycosylase-like protein
MKKNVLRAMCSVLCAACVVLGAGAVTPAAAEIVYLTSGRTVNVAGHRFEGDMVVLALRSGGEMVMSRALVERVAPDEVPWVPPVPRVPAGSVPHVPVPKVSVFDVPAQFDALITKAAEKHAVDPNLVRAVIKVESAWKPKARSHKGAMGLMQLMPATAREYGVRNAYDPAENINAGVKHLRSLLDRFDVRLAVAAYNAGAGAVQRYGGVPPYRETRDYVRKVLSFAGLQ